MIKFYKHIGETSLAALERARVEHAISPETPMTYAGTLDPMAEGLLLLLVGEECKEKDKYTSLSKEYEVEILFGISTDTDDILGLVQNSNGERVDINKFEKSLGDLVGRRIEKYHPYSHKKVLGIPLFEHAKSGNISEINIPEKETEIFSIKIISENYYTIEHLKKLILDHLSVVQGDFRQSEIVDRWTNVLDKMQDDLYSITIRVECSSGTYMRNLVRTISSKMDIPALALKITRTTIGKLKQ